MNHILFVCTGNTCRSPMAEGLFRKMVTEENLDIVVRSAGVSALGGLPISENSMKVLQSKGVEEAEMESSMISAEWVDWADLILTMTMNHKRKLIQRYPQALDKTYTLKEYVEADSQTMARVTEREQLIAELQMKQITSQPISEAERQRLKQLDQQIPNFDIADPYGGSIAVYEQSANEIERCLHKLMNLIKAK